MTGPLAGEPRERRRDVPVARRVGSWLVWWVLMMSFWVLIDDSISTDELLAGAGAAALAALLAELVTYQAATRFRMRIEWLVPALSLPAQVACDTVIIYQALWRRLAHGEQPPSAFADLPTRPGDDHEEQSQEGLAGVLIHAVLHQHRQRHQRRSDQTGRGHEVQLLVGIPHHQHADRGGEHDQHGQAEQDAGENVLDYHSQRSRARMKTRLLPYSSTAIRTGNSNSAGRLKPSASSASTITRTEAMNS